MQPDESWNNTNDYIIVKIDNNIFIIIKSIAGIKSNQLHSKASVTY